MFKRTYTFALSLMTAFWGIQTGIPAFALPQGWQVVKGNVSFEQSGNSLTVTSQSRRAVVKYVSFNLASGESVNFILPDSSSRILNRVIGGGKSVIAGNIMSNGHIGLVNTAGIQVANTAQIQAIGVLASTLNISDESYFSDTWEFQKAGNAAGIVNADWFVTNGGDGFESQVDPTNPDIIYAQSQHGNLVRYDRKSGEAVFIQPQPEEGEERDDLLDAGIVERIRRVVGEHAGGAVVVLLAGRVGRHARRGVGDHRIQGGGHHQAGDVQRVHREPAERLAVAHPARDDACRRPVGRAHAVAEQEDDVLRARRPPARRVPGFHRQPHLRRRPVGGPGLDDDGAGPLDAAAAQQKRRRVRRGAAAGRRIVARREVVAVQRDAQRLRRRARVGDRLDADVEPLPGGQHAAVGRHDADRRGGRGRKTGCGGEQQRQESTAPQIAHDT